MTLAKWHLSLAIRLMYRDFTNKNVPRHLRCFWAATQLSGEHPRVLSLSQTAGSATVGFLVSFLDIYIYLSSVYIIRLIIKIQPFILSVSISSWCIMLIIKWNLAFEETWIWLVFDIILEWTCPEQTFSRSVMATILSKLISLRSYRSQRMKFLLWLLK